MRLWFRLLHVSLLLAWWAQPCFAAKISGTVRTNDGTPLANVAIYVERDVPQTRTASDGSFVFETTIKTPVIFIAHAGYRPAVRVIRSANEGADIVLEPEALSTWWVTTCSSERPVGKVIELSGGPRIVLPKGVKYRTRPGDIDFEIGTIKFGRWWHPQELEFWIGGAAAGPIPPSYLFEDAKEFTVRYWRGIDKSREGTDAGGSDSKGRRWRYVNIGTTGIMYRQVSEAAAKFFDGIIDSICIPATAK